MRCDKGAITPYLPRLLPLRYVTCYGLNLNKTPGPLALLRYYGFPGGTPLPPIAADAEASDPLVAFSDSAGFSRAFGNQSGGEPGPNTI